MAKPRAATAEPEAEGQEQEPQTPQDDEQASPPEAEAQEQRGDETPHPLAEVTFEQLRQHPRFKADWENLTATQKEERNKAWREGQSAGAKQASEDARRYAADQNAMATYDQLEQKRRLAVQGDMDAQAEFAEAMGHPDKKELYDRGAQLRMGPSREDIEKDIGGRILTSLNVAVDERLSKVGELRDEEKAKIERGNFKTFNDLTMAKIDLLIEREVAAGRMADDAKRVKEAKEEGRREAYDEVGLEYPPDELKGGKGVSGRVITKADLDNDRLSQKQLQQLEREGRLDTVLRGGKVTLNE